MTLRARVPAPLRGTALARQLDLLAKDVLLGFTQLVEADLAAPGELVVRARDRDGARAAELRDLPDELPDRAGAAIAGRAHLLSIR